MLSLGVPVADAAVSADVPEDKAESYVRGTKLVPTDAVNLDFDAVALMGDYDDVLTEDDVVAILSKKGHWDRVAVCQAAAHGQLRRAPEPSLMSAGIRIVEDADIRDGNYHYCDGECGHAGLVATVSPNRWSEDASVHFYCDDDSHVHQPTPEEIAADEAYEQRADAYEAMQARIVEFAKSALPKFPAKARRSCASGRTRPSRPPTSASRTTPGRASRSRGARRSTSSSSCAPSRTACPTFPAARSARATR